MPGSSVLSMANSCQLVTGFTMEILQLLSLKTSLLTCLSKPKMGQLLEWTNSRPRMWVWEGGAELVNLGPWHRPLQVSSGD